MGKFRMPSLGADMRAAILMHWRVKPGDKVKRGDIIGESGQTGDAKEPRLHFEVRKFSVPIDPLPLLDGA